MIQRWMNEHIHSGDWAILIVVLAGYSMYYSGGLYQVNQVSPLITSTLGLVYLAVSIWGSHRLESASARTKMVFFPINLLLGGVITYLTNGGTWMILLPLVSESIQHLPVVWSVVVVFITWLISFVPMLRLTDLASVLSPAMAYLSAIVFVAVFTASIMREQKMRRELAEANQRLREYTSQIERNAILEERNRLAREIHDGLGHYLTAVNIQLKAAQAILEQDPSAAIQAVNKAQTLSEEALADVRRSVTALRTDQPVSQKASLVITPLVESNSSDGLKILFNLTGNEVDLPPHVVFTIYRIVQEALTNTRKHAQASSVNISLKYLADHLELSVADDGVGMDLNADRSTSHFGLLGLKERVQMMGGNVDIQSSPGAGMTLLVSLPYPAKPIPGGSHE
jgi:signal transduction histidine kinase